MNSVKTLIIKLCRDEVLKLVSIFWAGMWLRSLREGQRVNVLASDLEGEGDREDGRQVGITRAAFAGGIGATDERERWHDGYRHVVEGQADQAAAVLAIGNIDDLLDNVDVFDEVLHDDPIAKSPGVGGTVVGD